MSTVSIRRFRRASRAVWNVLRTEGIGAVPRHMVRFLRRNRVQDPFDLQHGVDTGGIVSLFQLTIASPNEECGTRYQASPEDICEKLIAALPIQPERFVFVDLGAGKGRVLLVASKFPFKSVIGVEFAEELASIARTNMVRNGCRAEIVHCDAAQYAFPPENLVVYMYNPFGPSVMRPILASLQRHSSTHDVYLIYLRPEHAACVAEFAQEIDRLESALIYRVTPQNKTASTCSHA